MEKAPKAPEHLLKFERYLPHQAWLLQYTGVSRHDPEGADPRRADLRGVDLRGVDLRDADLRSADFQNYANLGGACLSVADLRGVDLRGANLHSANLNGADLRGANLICVYCYRTVFTRCSLSGAELSAYLIEYLAKHYPVEYLGYVLSADDQT